jgi:hypothetical protein
MSESVDATDRPENAAELADYIESLTVFSEGGEGGYQQSADAMWKAALAAFNYTARRVGATGFQGSWAALRFYGEAMHVDGPFMVVQLHDALYPQYDIPARVQGFIDESRDWLRGEAVKKLAGDRDHAAPQVVAHWQELAR